MNRKSVFSWYSSAYILISGLLLSFSSCDVEKQTSTFDYGTKNDSARFYYLKGFHEILDNGRWTESERSYRKALEFDPDYPLGKSLVGRITRNLDEREKLLEELLSVQDKVSPDEQLLLEVYLSSMESYNNRDKGIKASAESMAKRKQMVESNFREFVRKYPDDDYVKAEYIEWLHVIHGPKAALDSLNLLATVEQKKLGFYISFAASLELELGNLDQAVALSRDLKKLMADSTYTSYMKLKAEISIAQDSMQKAKRYLDQILAIDPNHIIALGMLLKVEAQIDER